MDLERIQKIFQSQDDRVVFSGDPESAVKAMRKKQKKFRRMVLRRDILEVSVGLILVYVLIFIIRPIFTIAPDLLYLAAASMLFLCMFFTVDRIVQHKRNRKTANSIAEEVEKYLHQVNHQIWLLRNVFWWYLLPCIVSFLLLMAAVAIEVSPRWETLTTRFMLHFAGTLVLGAIVNVGVYYLNQYAVKKQLLPRKDELEALLQDLTHEE